MSTQIDTEVFKKRVKNNYNGDGDLYDVIGEYLSAKDKIEMKYLPLNKKFITTPNHFLNGRRPKFVANINARKTTEDFKKEVYDLVGDEYTVLGEYITTSTPIKMRHNSDMCNNHIFYVTPSDFKKSSRKSHKGHRCPICSMHVKDHDFDMKYLSKKFEKSYYKIVDVDIPNNIVTVLDTRCGHTFQRKRTYLRSAALLPDPNLLVCPYCNVHSRAELLTTDFLQKNNVHFIEQSKMPGLQKLRFDYQIFYDSDKFFLLELDGPQHYQRIDYFDSCEDFDKRQLRNQKKNDYCKEHNIDLYRIKLPKQVRKNNEEKILTDVKNIIGHYKLL